MPFLKQAISFGLKKDAKIAQPLHFLDYAKEGGAEIFQDIYGATHFCHELAETLPQAKRYVDAYTKKFNRPPDSYSGYGYNGIKEVARGVELAKSTDSEQVANALRKNREYDHYKGKQYWRACDNKSFQDLWILKVRAPQQVKGEWGFFDVVGRIAGQRGARPDLRRKGTRLMPRGERGERDADVSLSALAAQAFTGLVLGGILVLMAIGLSLIFGLMTVVNFSHGALYMLGAYVAFTLLGLTKSFWVDPGPGAARGRRRWASSSSASSSGGSTGGVPDDPLLLTFGLSLVLVETVKLVWGKIGLTFDPAARSWPAPWTWAS